MRMNDYIDGRRRLGAIAGAAALLAVAGAIAAPPPDTAGDLQARVARVLAATPLIDGHNDLPEQIRNRFKGNVGAVNLAADTSVLVPPADEVALMTDLPRLRAGMVGGQFWSVYISVALQGAPAVRATLEQIDIVHEMVARYPRDLEMAYTAADIVRIHRAGRIASLIGVEGGHQIDNSLPVLRQYYLLGARYMTLTHATNTDWADAATDNPVHKGLTPFGREVVREMNRLGMLVDLSHVSPATMRAALEVSAAPVIYSHSSARALVDHPRDVPEGVFARVDPVLDGRVLGGQAEGVPAHRVQGLSPRHPLAAVERVAQDVVAAMAHVQPAARGIRVHVQHVELVAGHGGVDVGHALIGPAALPLLLDLARRVLLDHGSRQYNRQPGTRPKDSGCSIPADRPHAQDRVGQSQHRVVQAPRGLDPREQKTPGPLERASAKREVPAIHAVDRGGRI